jgi:hypothetical protein
LSIFGKYLSKYINVKNAEIPNTLKTGIGCPIFKNGGKPKEDPNSYRRITVTSAIGKILGKLHSFPFNFSGEILVPFLKQKPIITIYVHFMHVPVKTFVPYFIDPTGALRSQVLLERS